MFIGYNEDDIELMEEIITRLGNGYFDHNMKKINKTTATKYILSGKAIIRIEDSVLQLYYKKWIDIFDLKNPDLSTAHENIYKLKTILAAIKNTYYANEFRKNQNKKKIH